MQSEKYSVQHLEIVFKNAIQIPGIKNFHFIELTNNGYLKKGIHQNPLLMRRILMKRTATLMEVTNPKSKQKLDTGTHST